MCNYCCCNTFRRYTFSEYITLSIHSNTYKCYNAFNLFRSYKLDLGDVPPCLPRPSTKPSKQQVIEHMKLFEIVGLSDTKHLERGAPSANPAPGCGRSCRLQYLNIQKKDDETSSADSSSSSSSFGLCLSSLSSERLISRSSLSLASMPCLCTSPDRPVEADDDACPCKKGFLRTESTSASCSGMFVPAIFWKSI